MYYFLMFLNMISTGEEILAEIVKIVPTLEGRQLYRGLGGEYMKQATAVLIEKASLAVLPLHDNSILSKTVFILYVLSFCILILQVTVVTGNGMTVVYFKESCDVYRNYLCVYRGMA